MASNNGKNDMFQRMGDTLFGGSRSTAKTVFWLCFFMMPFLAVLAVLIFGILPVFQQAKRDVDKQQQRFDDLNHAYGGGQSPAYARGQQSQKSQQSQSQNQNQRSQQAQYGQAQRPAARPAPPPRPKAPARPVRPRPQHTGNAQADRVLDACYEFLCKADPYLPEIDDPEVHARAQETCAKVQAIMDLVKSQPETAANAGRLSSYYLPTTLKLLHTYTSVDDSPGPNAKAICKQIHKTLITLNKALSNLQDDLLGNTALDVEAEISAMEQMLGSEGLTDELRFSGLGDLGNFSDGE